MSLKDPLLLTKLSLPSLSYHLVSRPRLTRQMDEALKHKLTLISAPAGYGKTTLVCEWLTSLSSSDIPVAWVTLDDDDNDPIRFWSYVLTAVNQLHTNLGEQALTLLQSPQPSSIETILAIQINTLLTIDQNFVLVLDDYHTIKTQSIHSNLTFFLKHMPSHMHLVLVSRGNPPISLSQLRTNRQVAEIHTRDLCFKNEEVADFLKETIGIDISTEDIATMERRTEGWVAGMQLAVLSLMERSSPSIPQFLSAFAGSHRHISDYLADEVFLRQPEQIQSWLLQTSILYQLNSSLCDAVTGGNSSQQLLEQMKQLDVFLISLDEERKWYRYHPLFAEFLRSRLKEQLYQNADETTLAILHNRASVWYEHHGQIVEAITHALANEEFDRSNHLIGQVKEAYISRFADEETLMAALFKQLQGMYSENIFYVDKLLATFKQRHESTIPPLEKQKRKKLHSFLNSLSEREFEVVQCLVEGMSNKEIAEKIVIAESTVKWHLRNIYGKLNVHNRTQAILKAKALTE